MAEILSLPPRLSPQRVQLATAVRRVFHATLPSGTSLETALLPEFWAMVATAHRLVPLDRIEVVDDGVTFFAELLCVDVDATGVTLKPLRGFELGDSVGAPGRAQRATGGERVRYGGPHRRWVVESSAGEILSEGHQSEQAASMWLADLLRARQR